MSLFKQGKLMLAILVSIVITTGSLLIITDFKNTLKNGNFP